MLLGIYGMFATGKTTFLDNFKDRIADTTPYELTIVLADLADEYKLKRSTNEWIVTHNKPRYKDSQTDKKAHIDNMIGDPARLWIVESARYFGGLHEYFIERFQAHNGGLKFIVPICHPDTARKFLMERCIKRNKVYRAEYWTPQRLEYESEGRYTNAMNNRYKPAKVEFYIRMVDYERTAWEDIGRLVLQLSSTKFWYNNPVSIHKNDPVRSRNNDNEDMPNQRDKRQRQDHHSQAAAVRFPRR